MLGGGTAPILATRLTASQGSSAVGLMLAAFGLLSLVCALALPETRHRAMHPKTSPQPDLDVVRLTR